MTKLKKLLIIGAVTVIGVGAVFISSRNRDNDYINNEPIYSQLTGREVSSEEPILGVMIENSVPARPQTGLGSAGVVFEAVTEGGITRFLALYQEDLPETVTPIRSLRPIFLDWAMGFDASIAHVGGSPRALELVDERNAKSLNQFTYPDPYYRTETRDAPHNMAASTQELRQLQKELNHDVSSDNPWLRTSDEAEVAQEVEAAFITIDFSSPTYAVEYRYNPETHKYARFMAGTPHIDANTGDQLQVDNVVVIRVDSQAIDAIGKGKATIFSNGKVQEGAWRKETFKNSVKFLDNEGNDIPLAKGSTWIAALPINGDMTYESE